MSTPHGISRRRLIAGAGTASATAVLLGSAPAIAQPAALPPGGQVVPILPVRIFDSRTDTTLLPFFGRRKFQDGDSFAIGVAGAYAGSPSGYAVAIFGNLTITETEGAGYLVMAPANYSGEGPAPVHSNINWWQSGITIANSFLCGVGSEHSIVVGCRGGRTHVIIDAFGYIPVAF
jgi:hypothetical protein